MAQQLNLGKIVSILELTFETLSASTEDHPLSEAEIPYITNRVILRAIENEIITNLFEANRADRAVTNLLQNIFRSNQENR